MPSGILGLDVGTSSVKAVLFDTDGAIRGEARVAYPLATPRPGWVEQDPETLWQALLRAAQAATAQAPELQVRGLAMAAQSGSLLLADETGRPLAPFITWMDGRSAALVARWRAEGRGSTIRAVSGWSLHPGLGLPTLAWLGEEMPALLGRARRILSVNDFLAHRLTGRFATNPSNAAGLQLLDVRTGDWSPELCALAGISPERLSPVRPSGAVIGRLRPEAAQATGLPQDAVVVNGGHDQACTALALGITQPGRFLLACGTAWVLTGVTDRPDPPGLPATLDVSGHVLPHRWTISQSLGGLGASLEWWVAQAWQGPDPARPAPREARFAALDRELAETRPGSRGLLFLPMTGGHRDPSTSRAGGFLGLGLEHSRGEMARAILESGAYELAWALDPVQAAGLPVDALWMVGGGARSALWPAILADVTGLAIHLPQGEHWPALGAALLAGAGSGLFPGLEEGRTWGPASVARTVTPDGERERIYRELFVRYRKAVREWAGEARDPTRREAA